jgi:hypothetical protein
MKLVERATNMLLRPRREWAVVAGETTSVPQLYRGYIAPLAAIYPIASVIGFSVIGISLPLVGSYRVPFGESIRHALFGYVLGLVAVYVLALVVDWLAPRFGGRRDRVQALKLAAFAYTPSWLAGLLVIFPWLSILGLVAAIYSLYLLYVGLPVLMASPRERRLGYFLSVMVIGIAINVAALLVVGAIFGAPGSGGSVG